MSKRIVLCADGTWNTPHGVEVSIADTNVRKLYCSLQPGSDQLAYYDSGVGTNGTPLDHLIGGAMGEGLFEKLQDNYQYLAFVWDPGDDIYLFGFSRGAFTARSLGGMIAKFGVPTKNFDNMMVRNIFEAYRQTNSTLRAAMKAELTEEYGLTDVSIRMVGVWDTVGSLGIPGLFFGIFDQRRYGFLDTTLNPCVKKAFHAVCIDERRAQFMPTLWTNPDGTPRANDDQLQQVWFAGVHGDVGGGYAEADLSLISLRWMMKKAMACGLTFKDEAVKQFMNLPAAHGIAPGHDEWKLIPWGIPMHRTIPENAVIASTVIARLVGLESYSPENLTLKDGTLSGYTIEEIFD